MELLVLDRSFMSVSVIDVFESVLWTDRYDIFGDFELYTSVDDEMLAVLQDDYYVWMAQSNSVMIIDERRIETSIELGDHLVIRGRSLESLLTRRIIWKQTILNGNFQAGILRLLMENVIDPMDSDRRIDNFIFIPSTDPSITSLTINTQFTGDNLYDAIVKLCKDQKIGFMIRLTPDNKFAFTLYRGTDRSYAQIAHPYVIFSAAFENLLTTNYLESTRLVKTTALIAGEGEGVDRRTTTIGGGEGLARRELFVDARDISSDTDDGKMPDEQYITNLKSRGQQKMTEHVFVKTFEGDVETIQSFVYGEDFYLGDVVQIINEYGIEASARIVELIISSNNEGNNMVPTFSMVT